ncbi:MAG: hypothetical protein Q9213_008311 [Squamulea squamosa]
MRARITKTAKPAQAAFDEAPTDTQRNQDPVKLLLLPQSAGPEARICTLAHPSTSRVSRYYWCQHRGLYELQKVSAPRTACRSWLLGPKTSIQSERIRGGLQSPSVDHETAEVVNQKVEPCAVSEVEDLNKEICAGLLGHTIKESDITIATPVDVLFIALPFLHAQTSKSSKPLFLTLDDLFETADDNAMHLKYLLEQETLRQTVEARITAICDSVDAGDEKMYRLNMDKLTLELVAKARRMSSAGLPASLEAKFVDKALEMPMISLEREASSVSSKSTENVSCTDSSLATTIVTQFSVATDESSESEVTDQTDVNIPDQQPPPEVPNDLRDLLRLRTALNFIISSYLPTSLTSTIQTILGAPSGPIDFEPLDKHLAYLANLRLKALASRPLSNISRKRSMIENDEAAVDKAEKRRKKEEEEKRQKTGMTKGIKDLKKVDVTGMRKMSDFFGKKPAQAKK